MPAVSHNVELHTKRYFVSVTTTEDGRFCSGSKQPSLDFSFRTSLLNRIGTRSGRLAGLRASRIWQAILLTISSERSGSMFTIDQIVFENMPYIKSMSVMAGQDCSVFRHAGER